MDPDAEIGSVAREWDDALAEDGYEHSARTPADLDRLRRPGRVWRDIYRVTGLQPPGSVLEAGCGGGIHLAHLALSGYDVVGVDASRAVLERATRFVEELQRLADRPVAISLELADFLRYETDRRYDMVFNVGVVEHFLDDGERAAFMRKQIDLCKPGGFSVHVVPSGVHPQREAFKRDGLGGYSVPEVDFSADRLRQEMEAAGGVDVRVCPENLFGYLPALPGSPLIRRVRRLGWLGAQVIPRRPTRWTCAHAMSFLAISRRPR